MKNTLLLNVFAGVLLAVSMASAQNMDSIFVRRNYGKQEYQLPMRDGITLYTIVYTPKDKSRTYPIMMKTYLLQHQAIWRRSVPVLIGAVKIHDARYVHFCVSGCKRPVHVGRIVYNHDA